MAKEITTRTMLTSVLDDCSDTKKQAIQKAGSAVGEYVKSLALKGNSSVVIEQIQPLIKSFPEADQVSILLIALQVLAQQSSNQARSSKDSGTSFMGKKKKDDYGFGQYKG